MSLRETANYTLVGDGDKLQPRCRKLPGTNVESLDWAVLTCEQAAKHLPATASDRSTRPILPLMQRVRAMSWRDQSPGCCPLQRARPCHGWPSRRPAAEYTNHRREPRAARSLVRRAPGVRFHPPGPPRSCRRSSRPPTPRHCPAHRTARSRWGDNPRPVPYWPHRRCTHGPPSQNSVPLFRPDIRRWRNRRPGSDRRPKNVRSWCRR